MNIKKVFISSLLALTSFNLVLSSETLVLANDTRIEVSERTIDEINYEETTYNEEAEYVQLSLNKLGITDDNGKTIYADGYFTERSRTLLSKFLKLKGYEYFTSQVRDDLFKQAESSVVDTGESASTGTLPSTPFIYSNLANLDGKWDPFYSMNILKGFEYLVTIRPDQMNFKSMRVVEALKKNTDTFGYINLGPNNPSDKKSKWRKSSIDTLKTQIDIIADAGWHGVFVDQFGYDWGETRERQNAVIDYAHKRGLSVMANSWFAEDALGSTKVKKANPKGTPTHLNERDWFLVESFVTDGNNYRADEGYIEKFLNTKKLSEQTGVKVVALSYKRNSTSWDEAQEDIKTSYVLAKALGFDGWWFAKYDNSDNFHYGKKPELDLGHVTEGLRRISKNKYRAEFENFVVEYEAEKGPILNLISK